MDFIAPIPEMLYKIPYHYFTPPHTNQSKNEIGQTPTHPLNHY